MFRQKSDLFTSGLVVAHCSQIDQINASYFKWTIAIIDEHCFIFISFACDFPRLVYVRDKNSNNQHVHKWTSEWEVLNDYVTLIRRQKRAVTATGKELIQILSISTANKSSVCMCIYDGYSRMFVLCILETR